MNMEEIETASPGAHLVLTASRILLYNIILPGGSR